MLESFILHWGYLAVGSGTFVEGETILIAAGAFSHRGLLSSSVVLAVAFVSSLVGYQLWFYIGRHFGRQLIARRTSWTTATAHVERWLQRRGSWFVFGFRFIYGIRIITPVVLGASGYPARRFFALNALSGAVWSLAVWALGYALGASLHTLVSRTARVEEIAAMALAIVIVLRLGGRVLRRVSGT